MDDDRRLSDDMPTSMEAYAWAWPVLKRCFVELMLFAIVFTVVAAPAGIARHAHARLFAAVYSTLIVVPVGFGTLNAYLRAVRGHTPRTGDLLAPLRTRYPQIVLAHLLWVTFVGAGLVFLVVPGLFVATRLAFVGFLVVDERMDAVDAIRESWRRTQGYGATIFGVFALGIPLAFLGLLALGVGIVPAIVWTHLAFAVVFDEVTASERAAAPPLAAPAGAPG